jgi:hypothetical protein
MTGRLWRLLPEQRQTRSRCADSTVAFPSADGGPPGADRYELGSAANELEDAVLALERSSGWSDPADGIRSTRNLIAETDEP